MYNKKLPGKIIGNVLGKAKRRDLKVGDTVELTRDFDLENYVLKKGTKGRIVEIDDVGTRYPALPYRVDFSMSGIQDRRVFNKIEIRKI